MLNRKWLVTSAVMIASMVLAACQPQTIIQTVEVTKEVVKVQTSIVKETSVVVKETVQVVETVVAADFSTPHPIIGDLKVRQAIAHCANRVQIAQAGYPGLTEADYAALQMDSFIQTPHWAHAAGLTQYPFDVAKGAALLDEAGWKLKEGAAIRANDKGDELRLHFTTTNAAFRQTWAAVFEKNMADCGIGIVRLHAPGSWWFGSASGLRRRDFELGAFAWVGEADPGGRSLYACDQIPTPGNGWKGQNYMGWCNEAASNAIKSANNTLNRDERIKQYAIVQTEFAKDMPSLPIFSRANFEAHNSALQGFAPGAGEPYTTYNIADWSIEGADTLVLGFTQEPASLFLLVESAFVATNAASLINGRVVNSLNYDYKANLYLKGLPTIDNGGAKMNIVEVKAGDKVVDTNGDIVEVKDGVKLKDMDGNEVEFKGTAVKMPQLVMNFEFEPGIKWSDGEPLKAADFELGKATDCNPESGAVDFTYCERTVDFKATDTTQTVTLMPGYLLPTYFTGYYGWYPSHQKLSDGRILKDVPAKEWSTLKEIAETPLGTGPYMVTAWEKGQSMTFEANPNFYKGAPKTKKIIIKFIADSQQAVAQLLTGDVDVLFGETVLGVEAKTISEEALKGTKVKLLITPSATWEHIDFNLFTK